MQINKITPLFLLLLIPGFLFAQADVSLNEIKNSGKYIYGIGLGTTIPEADQAALHNLVSQISVEVESSFTSHVKEENGELSDYTKRVVNTYSNTRLQQARMKVLPDKEGNKHVLRFISKEDLKEVFEQRKQKVFDYYMMGQEAEKELRIGDALKNYYWSLALLRSHPENSKIRIKTEGQGETTLLPLLNSQIERLLSNLHFVVDHVFTNKEERKKTVALKILYQDAPVSNIDYKYFTGDVFSQLVGGKDGKGVIELFDASASSLEKVQLYVEYKYKHKWKIDDEVRRVMENTNLPGYSKSKIRLDISTPEMAANKPGENKAPSEDLEKKHSQSLAVNQKDQLIKNTMKVVNSLQDKSGKSVQELFTDAGYGMFKELLMQGNVTILFNDTAALNVVKVNNQLAVRSIPMMFAYQNNNRKFVEDVVFLFNEEMKIEALSFALSQIAIRDILKKSNMWGSPEEKYTLIHFMENYKTAYSLKRLNYLESVFDDNALIIVGHVLKKDEEKLMDGISSDLDQQKVKYIRMSKDEYIDRLSNVFRSNEYINIDFEDNEVRRLQNDKIYGIQINQHYYSTNYADKGYLFLMVDLKDTLNPRVYVRTWQPEKFKDGSVIGLKNFHF